MTRINQLTETFEPSSRKRLHEPKNFTIYVGLQILLSDIELIGSAYLEEHPGPELKFPSKSQIYSPNYSNVYPRKYD